MLQGKTIPQSLDMHPFLTLASRFGSTLLPGSCHLCGRRVSGRSDLCPACFDDLPWITTCCDVCAVPLPLAGTCGRCQISPPAFDRCRSALAFTYPLDHLVRRFKFDRDLAVGRLLGKLLAEHIRMPGPAPTLLLPVPLHPSRQRERGFNQSVLLASALGRATRIPVDATGVRRVKDTAVQSGLDAGRRRRNVANAFQVDEEFLPAHVAIVDDVATTGSTLNELAKALKKAGVQRVDAFLLARTPLD